MDVRSPSEPCAGGRAAGRGEEPQSLKNANSALPGAAGGAEGKCGSISADEAVAFDLGGDSDGLIVNEMVHANNPGEAMDADLGAVGERRRKVQIELELIAGIEAVGNREVDALCADVARGGQYLRGFVFAGVQSHREGYLIAAVFALLFYIQHGDFRMLQV